MDSFIDNINTIIKYHNNDKHCLLYAILIGKQCWDRPSKERWNPDNPNINNALLKNDLSKIIDKFKLENRELGLEHVKIIEMYFKDYQICVLNGSTNNNDQYLYINNEYEFKKYIYILHNNNHFYAIRSIRQYYQKPEAGRYRHFKYFCHMCKKGFSKNGDHVCKNTCNQCKRLACPDDGVQQCGDCNNVCNNEKCLNIHLEKYCIKKRKCDVCGFTKRKIHACLKQHYCKNCKKIVDDGHLCYILTESERKLRDKNVVKTEYNNGIIFFDFETKLNERNIHEPFLIMAKKLCKDCIDKDEHAQCIDCVVKYEFYSNTEFCNWLFMHKGFISMAHNLKGFDGVFIMKHILNSLCPSDKLPYSIVNGTKILSIEFRGVKLIDSMSFIPGAL